ncbi:MAG: DUF1549 domain-containing protein [Pirellulales bacterium]
MFVRSLLGLLPSLGLVAALAHSAAAAEPATIDFAHQIAPILRAHCIKCHTGTKKEGALSLNTRAELLAGGESGPAVVVGKSAASELIARITTDDADVRMPPAGEELVPAEKIALLKRWIDAGLPWDEGFAFVAPAYEPPLRPRKVALPPAVDNRTNPIDRILDRYLAERKLPRPQPIDDAAFVRRAYLDLVGLLPTPAQLDEFLTDARPDRRAQLVARLLDDDMAYAEHWLSFWNDLLRNDYAGTGFITGGRKQISRWLYDALVTNMPYDQFARELIAPPSAASAGFGEGIKWRGDVSAGATVEIQFAQSVGQTFLGINLKCASCHDSFIDRWKLEESYGLAAVFATTTLEIHRCDKPIGKQARASWLFPELGQVDAAKPQPERLQQLAALMTHPENGRFTRTIVNRLWHRLMGRGIVHPTDAMQTPPWNDDLLDFLADDFAAHGYDLKQTLALIANSQAYQSRVQAVTDDASDDVEYVYAGPGARRLTAEQFLDAVWQLTGAAPGAFHAPVLRGDVDLATLAKEKLTGEWIWGNADSAKSAAGETFTFRAKWKLPAAPVQAVAVASCDNSYKLYVNNKQAGGSEEWSLVEPLVLTQLLKAGDNELLLVGSNGGRAPNAAGLYFEARARLPDGTTSTLATTTDSAVSAWTCTTDKPDARGGFTKPGVRKQDKDEKYQPDWKPVHPVTVNVWEKKLRNPLRAALLRGSSDVQHMVRASLVKSDFLMRSLGRPNRDQIVSVRPQELTTLEAIDLSNGSTLADALHRGAVAIVKSKKYDGPALVDHLFRFALARLPTSDERAAAVEILGATPSPESVEDLLWALLMLPEFQLVR